MGGGLSYGHGVAAQSVYCIKGLGDSELLWSIATKVYCNSLRNIPDFHSSARPRVLWLNNIQTILEAHRLGSRVLAMHCIQIAGD